MPEDLKTHFTALIPGILGGRVVPFLGAGVNLLERPKDLKWMINCGSLPGGRELFEFLAEKYRYPSTFDFDLARLTQYISLFAGERVLFDELNRIFEGEYRPGPVHRFFARLPGLLKRENKEFKLLILTTNYDNMMERAFQEVDEAYDVISYISNGPGRGKFLHEIDQKKVKLIEKVNKYRDADLKTRSIIIKMHGTVKGNPDLTESYVITVDDYLEYLMNANINLLLPSELVEKLYSSHFLFLGYALKDWNLQVILHRIWGTQKIATKSFAVQAKPDEVDKVIWKKRDVDIIQSDLKKYVSKLESAIKDIT